MTRLRVVQRELKVNVNTKWAAQSDQSSLCAQWVAKHPSFLHADSEDSDQTGRMSRLICVFTWCHSVGFVMRRLKCGHTSRPKCLWQNTDKDEYMKIHFPFYWKNYSEVSLFFFFIYVCWLKWSNRQPEELLCLRRKFSLKHPWAEVKFSNDAEDFVISIFW